MPHVKHPKELTQKVKNRMRRDRHWARASATARQEMACAYRGGSAGNNRISSHGHFRAEICGE
jgi:hypothetical protein